MRTWLTTVTEHLNRWDADRVSSRALPTDPPAPVVTALTTLAHGAGLWLALAALLATRPGGTRRAATVGIIAVALASVSAQLIKRLVPRRRPAADHLPARQALVVTPASWAFPSSHAATAAAFTTAVACESPATGLIAAPLALAVAYSRLRTRAHWPSDVAAGTLWGITVAVAAHRLLPRRSHHQRPNPAAPHRNWCYHRNKTPRTLVASARQHSWPQRNQRRAS